MLSKVKWLVLLLLCAATLQAATINCTHPCLEPTRVANAAAHEAANTAQWIAFKANLDQHLTDTVGDPDSFALYYHITGNATYGAKVAPFMWQVVRTKEQEYRITSISTANPAVVTTPVAHNLTNGATIWIMGATGDWAALNSAHIATVTGTTTFTIPVDTSLYMGAFPATITAFIGNPNLNIEGDWWRNNAYAFALGYDLARDLIVGDERDALIFFLAAEVQGSFNEWLGNTTQENVGGNINSGYLRTNIAVTIALKDDWVDAQSTYDTLRDLVGTYMIPALNGLPWKGGATPEGWEYGRQAVNMMLTALINIEAGTGEDVWALVENWPEDQLDHLLSSISPTVSVKNSFFWPQYGDLLTQNQIAYNDLDRAMISGLYSYFKTINPDATRAAYALYWLQNMKDEYNNDTYLIYEVMRLTAGGSTATDWRTGTNLTQYLASGMGIMSARSSWATDANWLTCFAGIRATNHWHNTSGACDWYRGATKLSVTDNGYNGIFKQQVVKNGPQVGVYPYVNGPVPGNTLGVFGQDVTSRYRAVPGTSSHVRYDGTLHWKRVTPGSMPEVDLVQSNFLYINPNFLVLFRHHTCEAPGCFATDQFQTPAAPATVGIVGDRITITNGDNKLFINGVYPTDLNYIERDNNKHHVLNYRKSNPALLLMDSIHTKRFPFTLILTGATDECTDFNGTWTATVPSGGVNNGFSEHGVTIPYDATSETCDMSDQDIETDLVVNGNNQPNGDRVDSISPTISEETYRFYVYESGDGSAVASTVTALTNLTNAIGAEFGDQVVAARTGASETATLIFNFNPTGSKTVRILGNTPSTGYARSVVGSTFTLSSPGSDVTADSAGVILTDDAGGTPTPFIGLAPTAFTFNATEGGANPATQSLSITNQGGGSLGAWTAAGSQAWLTCAPALGTDDATCAVTIDTTGLADMTYNETLTITAAAASNSPQVVNVTLVLSPAPVPTIAATPTSLAFMAALGDMDPSDTVAIDGGAVALGSWTCGVTAGAGLEVSPLAGAGNATLTITWVLTGLAAGSYNGNVQCTDPTATNTPFNIPVTLELTGSDPQISVDTNSPTMDSQTNAGRTQVITVTNIGGFHADWAWSVVVLGDECGLTITPTTGGTGETFTISASPPAGVNGRCTDQIRILDNYDGQLIMQVAFTVRRFLPLRIGP